MSIVLLITDDNGLEPQLKMLGDSLARAFDSFEILLINNAEYPNATKSLEALDPQIRENTILINLARREERSIALVAGMDFANGDYVMVADTGLLSKVSLIETAYKKAQEGHDIVALTRPRTATRIERLQLWLISTLLRRWANIDFQFNHDDWQLVTHRALNHILSIRDSRRSMKAIFAYVGFSSTSIELSATDIPPDRTGQASDTVKSALYALTSFTDILSVVVGWSVLLSMCIGFLAVSNAITVKLFGVDLLLQERAQVPGWAFLVVFQSTMFTLLFGVLYILSIYLTAINAEVRKKPLYFVESLKRF